MNGIFCRRVLLVVLPTFQTQEFTVKDYITMSALMFLPLVHTTIMNTSTPLVSIVVNMQVVVMITITAVVAPTRVRIATIVLICILILLLVRRNMERGEKAR
jgi:hypothetical protein